MRRFFAIVRATALEIASEPLALLLLMSALALAILTPALHYHQFGESSRMARDAGLSALLVGSLAFALFCPIKAFRREIESGTMQMALAHSVSRTTFFLAKICGILAIYGIFALTIFATLVTVVNGAEIGGRLTRATGTISPIWGRSFAIAILTLIIPPLLAALLNRFASWRWTLSTLFFSLIFAIGGALYRLDGALAMRLLPVATMLIFPAIFFAIASAACALHFRENAALAWMSLLLVVSLPLLGNYYLSDVLAKGGTLNWSQVLAGFFATAPLAAASAWAGIARLDSCDIGGHE